MAFSAERNKQVKLALRGCVRWGTIGIAVGILLSVIFTAIEGFKRHGWRRDLGVLGRSDWCVGFFV